MNQRGKHRVVDEILKEFLNSEEVKKQISDSRMDLFGRLEKAHDKAPTRGRKSKSEKIIDVLKRNVNEKIFLSYIEELLDKKEIVETEKCRLKKILNSAIDDVKVVILNIYLEEVYGVNVPSEVLEVISKSDS